MSLYVIILKEEILKLMTNKNIENSYHEVIINIQTII